MKKYTLPRNVEVGRRYIVEEVDPEAGRVVRIGYEVTGKEIIRMKEDSPGFVVIYARKRLIE